MSPADWKLQYLVAPALVLAWLAPSAGRGAAAGIGRWIRRIAARPLLAGAILFGLGLLIPGVAAWIRPPVPQVNDEFGYLLLGETFRAGRATNPTHPMWPFFESIHIFHQPTYTAKYPPGQGLAIALGLLLGHPILGVLLTAGLLPVAVYWMLRAWTRPFPAFLGGLLCAAHPACLDWAYGYWGGAVSGIGGALLLGGVRRLVAGWRASSAAAVVAGLWVLANSRPFEGFLLAVMAGLWVLAAAWRVGPARWGKAGAVLVAGAILIAAQLGWYHWRVSGNPLRMPYVVHEEAYGVAPLFVWQKQRPIPEYRHREIRNLHVGGWGSYQFHHAAQRSWKGSWWAFKWKSNRLRKPYLWSGLLLVPLAALPWAFRRSRPVRLAAGMTAAMVAAMFVGTWVFAHYAAPILGLFLFLVVESARRLAAWRPGGRRFGAAAWRWTALLLALSVPVSVARLVGREAESWQIHRLRAIGFLEQRPGKHLLVVRYRPDHNPHREWVYNGADLDGGKVLLAREMAPGENAALFAYYRDREVWVIDADAPEPFPLPYSGPPPSPGGD